MVTLLDVVLYDNIYGHLQKFNLLAIWMDEAPLKFFKPNENFKNTTPQSKWMDGSNFSGSNFLLNLSVIKTSSYKYVVSEALFSYIAYFSSISMLNSRRPMLATYIHGVGSLNCLTIHCPSTLQSIVLNHLKYTNPFFDILKQEDNRHGTRSKASCK